MLEKSLLLNDKKSTLPNSVGVYLFLDKNKEVLYVGKSTKIRDRVFSYFKNGSEKQKKIISSFFYVDYVLVDSEEDALFLENSFIKKHQPKYNILLKDDKSYPWLCLTNERFPRFFITRKKNSSYFYFGPYVSKKVLNNLYRLIIKNYPVRSCNYILSEKNIELKKYKVCLDYHIKKCLGPCEDFQSEKDYNKNIDSIKKILSGNYSFVLKKLKKQLKKYSYTLEFEKADIVKNQIIAINKIKNKSVVVFKKNINIDCFYVVFLGGFIFVNFIRVVEGSVVYLKNNKLSNPLFLSVEIILKNYIKKIYFEYGFLSKNIISNIELDLFLNKKIIIPKKGFKKKLLDFSYNNLLNFININNSNNINILNNLKLDLLLTKIPFHIECFDVSTLYGNNTISSCVVFKNGKPSKKDYKYFKINSVVGVDDYLSIEESIKKRYINCLNYPDLIIIDGGKGHLNSALKILKYLNLNNLNIISIAKKNEIIFLKNNKKLLLDKKSKSLKLIQYLRNEAHRFCLKKHRHYRNNSFINSEINNINGIGKYSFFKLIEKFKNLNNIKKSSQKKLINILGKKKGTYVYNYFNS